MSSCMKPDFIIIILLKLCVNHVADAILSQISLKCSHMKKSQKSRSQLQTIYKLRYYTRLIYIAYKNTRRQITYDI